MPPAVTAAARRAKRVIESETPESSEPEPEEEEGDDDGDEEEDDGDGDEEDAEDADADADDGEDEVEMEIDDEVEDEEGAEDDEVESEDAVGEDDEEEAEDEDDDDASAAPSPSGLKIKLRVAGAEEGGRGKRAAAQKAAKKTKRTAREAELGSDQDEIYEEDDLDSRAPSPSKMTARQRAKQNKDLQDTLISLPDGQPKVKPVLTEAERLQKREEMARRRKRQNEQRLQDEQDQTINRLLRAQTGRSRSKLDGPSPMPDAEDSAAASGRASGVSSPTKRVAPPPEGVRYVSRLQGEDVVLSVAVRAGRESWLDIGGGGGGGGAAVPAKRDASGTCAAKGCALPRKYRAVARFETGGCSLAHLKEVEAGLK
ncbi:uncharacterized protein LOC62_05G007283 [Vanrija pseudolonga]|uniref:INO80 complex subunit B-like conserved region domain-containing protein n=1 Tax=Vanrija pseudolonga TaxID=143232 RepID=A0AAF1BMT9_9TREE|nr:hypothetical protein LOC62_05G007283 [Vanrija pseudolonga]